MRGPLGVGKTTVSKILAKKIHAEYVPVDMFLKDHTLKSTLKANEIISKLVSNSKNSFVIDGCFYFQEQIDDLKKKMDDDVSIFTLISDIETCIKRDSKRKRVYGEDAARYVHKITTKIKAGYEIDNSDLTIQETANKIIERIN